MTASEVYWIKLHKIFKRVPRDRRVQKIIQSKMYTKMRSFLDNPIGMGVVSLSVTVAIIITTNPGIVLGGLTGLLVGMSTTFITTSVANRLKKMEENMSYTSVERKFAVETTLVLLEKTQSYSTNEDMQKNLTQVMEHLKDPTTSYALWRNVNGCLRSINQEHERCTAVNIEQAKINTAVEKLSNKMNPPQERVFKL